MPLPLPADCEAIACRAMDMRLSCAGATGEAEVVFVVDELPGCQLINLVFLHRCFAILKRGEVPVVRETCCAHAVFNGTGFTITAFGLDELTQGFRQAHRCFRGQQILGRIRCPAGDCHAICRKGPCRVILSQ